MACQPSSAAEILACAKLARVLQHKLLDTHPSLRTRRSRNPVPQVSRLRLPEDPPPSQTEKGSPQAPFPLPLLARSEAVADRRPVGARIVRVARDAARLRGGIEDHADV